MHVYAKGQDTLDAIEKVADKHGARVQVVAGNGEFLGTEVETGSDREQRDDAGRAFGQVIRQVALSGSLAGRDGRKGWNEVCDYWKSLSGTEIGAGVFAASARGRGSGARSADEAQRSAAQAASGYPHLAGLPTTRFVLNRGRAVADPPYAVTGFKLKPSLRGLPERFFDEFRDANDLRYCGACDVHS